MSQKETDPLDADEEEPKVPTGTWASVPDGESLDETPAAESTEREKRPSRPPRQSPVPEPEEREERQEREATGKRPSRPPPALGAPIPTPQLPVRGEAPEPDASESQVRPRYLASELLRRRSESHEPLWPGASRILGAVGGAAAAALSFVILGTSSLGIAAGVCAAVVAVLAAVPMPPPIRSAGLALVGGLAVVAGTLLSGDAGEMLAGAAGLTSAAGAFLRARRFASLGARILLGLGGACGLAALSMEGGLGALAIESFALPEVVPALQILGLGVVVLLPLLTLVDRHGPSGALAVAVGWSLERALRAGLDVGLDGTTAGSIGPLAAALVLPAAALGLAQAMPSAAMRPRRARVQDG